LDLRRLLTIARSRLPLLLAGLVLGGAVAFGLSSLQTKTYEAKTTLIVGQSLAGVGDFDQLLVSQRLSTTYAAVGTTRPILEAVISKLRLQTRPEDLIKRVRAVAQLDSTLVSVSAQDESPDRAAAIANALAAELIAVSPTIQGSNQEFQAAVDAELESTLAQIQTTQEKAEALSRITNPTPSQLAELSSIEDRLASLRSTYATLFSLSSSGSTNMLSVIEPAVAPVEAISPRILLNTLLGLLLGLLAAAGATAAALYFRDVIRDPDEVYEVTGMSTLGSITKQAGDTTRNELYRLVSLLYPRSGNAEAYRTLRANIEFGAVDAPLQTLLVTSSVPGEGKTVMTSNLAIVFAQSGRNVLLVDADLRRPGIDSIFRLANTRGLTTLLRDEQLDLQSVIQPTEQEHLHILTTGPLPPNPAELLASKRMLALIERLKASADLVIFDSPPLLAVADSAVLSSILDATVLVIDVQKSRRRQVRLACAALARAGAKVLGVALNRVSGQQHASYESYYESSKGSEESGNSRASGKVARRARTSEADR
jgi:capsular exopolysaccharide synthesis family protein